MKAAIDRHQSGAGLSRRRVLQAGGILGTALALPAWANALHKSRKALVHINLPGGPSHIDTFDMKPGAPTEIRGEFRPIRTKARGLEICELLPELAQLADRFSLIRSVTGLCDTHPALLRDQGNLGYVADCDADNERFDSAMQSVEGGTRYIRLDWGYWDTHGNNFGQMKSQLPRLDRGLSAFIRGLEQKGLLDDVLIVMCGEFGRTPKINRGAGRDHWSHASFVFLAGGGLKHGQVIGRTDRRGEYVIDRPIAIADVVMTIQHATGIDLFRPSPVNAVDGLMPTPGRVIQELV